MFDGALMPTHWLVILLIVLIVFGAGRLPHVMGDLGRGIKEFKKAQSDVEPAPGAGSTSTIASTARTAVPARGGAPATSNSDVQT